jgi:outer membrane protein assembly factor BamD (BamD/ComL family)
MALSVGQVEKSVKILNRIVEEYPDYSRMEDVMFNKASHLDFELRDTTQAKVAYQEFIDRYPDSELRDDAESRIENIQYSLEELAEKFILEMEAGENQDLP